MQTVTPKWLGHELVVVCERCYKQRIPEEDPTIAARIGDFDLRDWLKAKLKAEGHWGRVRVVASGCLDVCARGQVTVAIEGGGRETVLVLDPLAEREALYERIVNVLTE